MKKLLGLCLLGIGFLTLSGRAEAAPGVRGAKGSFPLNYTTTVSTVTAKAGVVYGVVLSTGASGEYIALFDANSSASITSAVQVPSSFKTRVFFNSTTANTTVTFDPPLQFNSGIIVGDSAATGQSLIIWEAGHVTQGY